MDRLLERCAGLDIHQATIVATVRTPDAAGGRHVVTQTYGTMTVDLLALRDWLQACGVTHVAMESTGVYWKPLYYLLEDGFTVLVVNMRILTRVPGRKSDVQDSAWLAELLECGLVHGSLVPPAPIRDLRDLTRYRKKQIEDRAQEVNRLYRVLEEAGVKLATVYWHYEGPDDSPVWDTHENNFPHLRSRLAPPTDLAVSALLGDLAARGLLEETLVIVMGEFGRSPKINSKGGREHWPQVQSVLLAGAGIRAGSVYGASDKDGGLPAESPVSPADLTATFLHLLGVPLATELRDPTGRPFVASEGTVVRGVLAP